MLRLTLICLLATSAHATTLYDSRERPALPPPAKFARARSHATVHHHRPRRFIIGGTDVAANDPIQRSTAALYSPSANGPGGALCTASLIAPNMAVTAAHCVQGDSYSPVMIFGNDVRSPSSVRRPVVGEVVNPAYGKSRGMDQGDIALVKFGGGLPPGYRPASIDTSDSAGKGDHAILAGYGVSNAQTHEGAGILRKTEVAVANPRKGKSEMIFDQAHGHGACHGDSGGPAYFRRGNKMVLSGVTNRSYPNTATDDCAHKVVYTKIASYRPWIQKSEDELNKQRAQLNMVKPAVRRPSLLAKVTSPRSHHKGELHAPRKPAMVRQVRSARTRLTNRHVRTQRASRTTVHRIRTKRAQA